MRIWTLHPRYLDPQGLVALWRETLLAQKVLAGKTRGYRHHPQLIRFQKTPEPLAAIGAYLSEIALESQRRNYRFNAALILIRKTNCAKKTPRMKSENCDCNRRAARSNTNGIICWQARPTQSAAI